MAGIGHNTPDIDWGWHARNKVMANDRWVSPDGMKRIGLLDRDITLYFMITHKLRYETESVQISSGLAAKLMCESKSTAYRRLLRLTESGLLKRKAMGVGKRGSIYSGNYSSGELEEIITSTVKAMRETLDSPLAFHPRVKRETATVPPMGETLNGKPLNATAENDLAFHQDPLAFHEEGLAFHSKGETTNANAKEYTNGSAKGKNGKFDSPSMSSKDWGDELNANRTMDSEDIWFDEKVGKLRISDDYRELVRGEGFSDAHINTALNTASKTVNPEWPPPKLKSHLMAYCQYAKNEAKKFNHPPKRKGFQV